MYRGKEGQQLAGAVFATTTLQSVAVEDTRLECDVAVKVLPTNLSSDPCLRQRLEREAKAISKLSHPHICTLHDIGHQDGMDFLFKRCSRRRDSK